MPSRARELAHEAVRVQIFHHEGELGIMDAGRISLAEFGQEWLDAYAKIRS